MKLKQTSIQLQKDEQYVAINIESGHFASVPQTNWDKAIDRGSSKPGAFLAEKQISGAYVHHIYNTIAKQQGLATIDEAADIDWIAADRKHPGSAIADSILERSAQLVAMELAGVLEFLGITKGNFPMVMEGSLFWKGYRYKARVERWLRELMPNITITFTHIPQSNLVGGAMLALTVE